MNRLEIQYRCKLTWAVTFLEDQGLIQNEVNERGRERYFQGYRIEGQ